jgi:hypothetical protein
MLKKQKLCMWLLLVSVYSLHSEESHPSLLGNMMERIGTSRLMNLFSTGIQKKIDTHLTNRIYGLGDEPASSEYQQLGKEAQDVLGIAVNRQLPIKKIPSTSMIYGLVGAIAPSDAIYVNEDKFNKTTYGARRCGLIHEAVHAKYHDTATDTALELGTLSLGAMVAYAFIKAIKPQGRYKILGALGLGVATLTVSYVSSLKFHHYMEHRADVKGHYASQCHVCVQEAAVRRREIFEVQNHALKDNGYLWAEQLEKIANDLKQQNKVCTVHSKI